MAASVTPAERHLLVTVSDDSRALYGLRFVNEFFRNNADLRLTLFYVEPPRGANQGLTGHAPSGQGRTPAFGSERGQSPEVLLGARKWLDEMGFPLEQVELKSRPVRLGAVKDIALEAELGLYDAVVLGRSGLGWFDEVFKNSTTHRLLWEAITCPVWVCRNPARHRVNVLLCADGSEASLRMADHVGFMLQNRPEHQVTVFHCRLGENEDKQDVERLLVAAGEQLRTNGVEEERISYLVKTTRRPAEAILHEASHGGYAAVAAGFGRTKPGAMASLFGSTSLDLLRDLEGSALWLSR